MEDLLNCYFCYSYCYKFCYTFFEQIFFRTPSSGWRYKNQQNLSTKIETWRQIEGARNNSLEITSLRAIILHILTSQLSQLYRVSLADLCDLLINTFEKLHVTNSEPNLQPPQHLKLIFL